MNRLEKYLERESEINAIFMEKADRKRYGLKKSREVIK